MRKLLLLLTFFYALPAQAQLLNFDWEGEPKLHKIENEKFLKESAVLILEDIQMEVTIGQKEVTMNRRVHKIVRVNDEKGIEMYNKVKIGYSPNSPILMVKARTITPQGKVIELKPEAFKDMKDEEGGMEKIFALEGVEKGAEIEYIFQVNQRYRDYGTITLQDAIPTVLNRFELVAPEALIFEMKGYNGVQIAKDTILNGKNCFLATASNLEGLEEEKYASYYPHFARVEYVLQYNLNNKGKGIRVYSWDDLAKNVNNNFTSFTDKELKAGKKLLDNAEYKKCKTLQERVEWIEHFVKTSFIQQEYVNDDNSNTIEFILKNKITEEFGIQRLFGLLFKAEEIPFEVGYTTSRFEKPFDYSLVNVENLKECFLYFPELKSYLAVNQTLYRMPLFPAVWEGNQSMVVKTLKLGDLVTASAEKRKLPISSPEKSYHNHDVSVKFNPDMDTAHIVMINHFAGHNAAEIMPILVFLENEKREDAVKEIIRISEKDEKIENLQYENNDYRSMQQQKPLKISSLMHTTNNIEKAGNKYLFKIGELIGRQAEMYQEKPRKFDLEIPNPHQYTRSIQVEIPKGYKVSNLDKLNMSFVAMNNGKESCKFVSTYTLEGNILKVNCFEIYHENYTPMSAYPEYVKVINAAADFNKIVLVLEKQ